MKKKLMGAGVAILLMGCGGDAPGAEKDTEAATSEFCGDVEHAVDSIRDGLGSCTANDKNQEPLAFSRAVCDAELSTACDAASLEHARQYVDCLLAVPACEPTSQALFDDAIDACADTFQNSGAAEACIERVVGD